MLLVEAGILAKEDRDTCVSMVRFRNRAVHLYDEIATDEVWKIVEGHLDDFERFIAAIAGRYLARAE